MQTQRRHLIPDYLVINTTSLLRKVYSDIPSWATAPYSLWTGRAFENYNPHGYTPTRALITYQKNWLRSWELLYDPGLLKFTPYPRSRTFTPATEISPRTTPYTYGVPCLPRARDEYHQWVYIKLLSKLPIKASVARGFRLSRQYWLALVYSWIRMATETRLSTRFHLFAVYEPSTHNQHAL